MTSFHHILANNLIANITNYTVWFALTFWVFLETRSVFATGMIAGLYLVLTAGLAIWFGSLVDHHRKKRVMLGSSLASLALYAVAFAVHQGAPKGALAEVAGPWLWALVGVAMLGVIAGNIRSIALPTLVTALVPEDRRDKANGLVGMVSGIGFLTTSVISGLLVAWAGMEGALVFALGLTVPVFLHLRFLRVDEPDPAALRKAAGQTGRGRVDLRGTMTVVGAVPGLFALILFGAFNNFLGGVFMALMDAYGLSLMPVQAWGFMWAGVSTAFILSGVIIARTGLGRNPLRTLMIVNLICWATAAVFTVQSSIVLLGVGCFIWMLMGPYAEAAEHTTLQKVVPFERQGRVFGFAQSVEQAASPLTAFMIAPLAQFVFIPFMTDGWGAEAIGGWYGTGPERGIALVFTVAGAVGLIATGLAWNSRSYRRLSAAYAKAPAAAEGPALS
ncbi:MAG: MFS transporter [Phenylobacterium sp.]|uniref:MFS transporter n=1 Tax=Brevundimonas sp. TaxID=1871086 RepID=UPI002737A710|nr:MFS transporter [Brevundimonas sp.]MDP3801576.1 MFS transporter [Brevundimonas sp.]MDZ4375244.1 MFS transporter [Phenylobacterium sp.]